ncbi:hypothetical protein OAB57_03580 [Bacteriovoracaceae bacterium]|nr:hypothetical protein [Bacteriovoracaceae bacterium]
MFDFLPEVCRELNAHLKELYWILLVPFTAFIIVLEFFKFPEEAINVGDVIKRIVISILLLLSFDECLNMLALIGDGITERIQGVSGLFKLMEHLGNNYKESEVSWLKFRDAVIFVLNLLSYIIAYVGVFVANVLMHFVWSILYVCSPLMILMYVSKKTSFVTSNLYKGLINVIVWKVLWSILGVLLLKLATNPSVQNWDNFLTSILVNLCIGLSMLFIPFTTKSLINDGMSSAATALAAGPTIATGTAIKGVLKSQGKRVTSASIQASRNRFQKMRNFVKNNVSDGLFKNRQSSLSQNLNKHGSENRGDRIE